MRHKDAGSWQGPGSSRMFSHIQVSISVLVFPLFQGNTVEYGQGTPVRSLLNVLLTTNMRILQQGKYLKPKWHKFGQISYINQLCNQRNICPSTRLSIRPSIHPSRKHSSSVSKCLAVCLALGTEKGNRTDNPLPSPLLQSRGRLHQQLHQQSDPQLSTLSGQSRGP